MKTIISFLFDDIKPKYKEDSTFNMVYWLSHPRYPKQKYLMQFNKDMMCYGNKFKLTLEYFRNHTEEFEIINPHYKSYWKIVNID